MKDSAHAASAPAAPAPGKRLLIVDDHPLVRKGLAAVFQQNPAYTVCGEAGSAPEALAKIRELHPDLVTVDLTLGATPGMELIKDIHAQFPGLPMLVVSMHDELLNARRVIAAGARGYLTKGEPAAELLTAAARILAGDIYVSHHLTSQMALQLAGRRSPSRLPEVENLSDRELEIFELTGDGLSVRQIADRLRLGPATVATYCHRIKSKLCLTGHAQMLQSAIRWTRSGTLPPPPRCGGAGRGDAAAGGAAWKAGE